MKGGTTSDGSVGRSPEGNSAGNVVLGNQRLRSLPSDLSPPSISSTVFTSCTNPVTGKDEWLPRAADYDYQQEVARSAYADMLHDSERNDKYEAGLRAGIAQLRAAGRSVHVLDIGTGTGLLSMMAVRLGADSVVACEAFGPMAKCAEQVLRDNGYADRVRVVHKRSTQLTVAGESNSQIDGKSDEKPIPTDQADLPHRCNLLVTEVFDTELIGEGALSTFRHAHQCLLEADSVVVPSSAVVYAQLIDSSLVHRWNRFTPVVYSGDDGTSASIHVPEDVCECHGAASVHDLQLNQLRTNAFSPLTDPVPVFAFDWSGRCAPLALERTSVARVEALKSGTTHAVFMWWDLTMDPAGSVLLSCAPHWAHPDTIERAKLGKPEKNAASQSTPWRDHWMQAIYYLPRELWVRRGSPFNLVSSHDEYSLWFAVNDAEDPPVAGRCLDPAPICLCGLHVTLSRTRIGALNDPRRHRLFMTALRSALHKASSCLDASSLLTVLVLSDACVYAVCAARLLSDGDYSDGRVLAVESSRIGRRALQMYCVDNDVEEKLEFVEADQLPARLDAVAGRGEKNQPTTKQRGAVDVLFAEPFYYSTTLLPWHPLHFWYRKQQIHHHLHDSTQIVPYAARLYCMAVEFSDLWKIRAPVGRVSGFDLTAFDQLVLEASKCVDAPCEPHPLWEYPCRALTRPILLDTYNIATAAPADVTPITGRAQFAAGGECNGVALWVDWLLDAASLESSDGCPWRAGGIVTTGPVEEPCYDGETCVQWDMYTRQAVYLLPRPFKVETSSHQLHWSYSFSCRSAEVNVDFSVQPTE